MPHPRQEILNHPDALDCTVYRPDEQDPDAEEQDLGDGKVLITGAFEPPQDWDAHQREDYYGEEDPTHFVSAHIECLAKPATREFFMPESGDYVAVQSQGEVVMYYVYDHEETEHGRHYVLIRDDEEL
ncbi:hypothetical protein N5O88_10610 [Pseudomonas sp. GD03721]|nr:MULTISPECIES: hypothetical protein [unclassified Pseudomonas]MDH1444091.1 hypothetical protein [Pseudomonas sp. GD03722]WGG03622.1 hypothetical protein N5O88_10610 [Pseudomonas sp. GD03721]WGG07790.1 hypothetical protein N5O87_10620 [Pseudomonas sp. GD03919]